MRKFIAIGLAAALLLPGCVAVDNSLGKGLVDKTLLFDTYTVSFPLEEIEMRMSDGLSGYSDSHLTLGAIRDDVFGLTTREAAFNLIPALDTLDLGSNPQAVSFDLYFEGDTISCAQDDQTRILQNIYVTELTQRLPTDYTTSTQEIPHGTTLITKGTPVYNGSGYLTFNFTKEFAQKYVDGIRELGPVLKDRSSEDGVDKYEEYLDLLPGIHLRTDVPEGRGGRINLFNFSCLSVSNNYYQRNNNVSLLKVHSTWNGVEKDSTFILIPGETEFADEAEYVNNNLKFYQYCFNRTGHSTSPIMADAHVLVEGGGGMKPVISASELRRKTLDAIAVRGGNTDEALIVKATILLPFEMPEDYQQLKYFPTVLSPTIRKVDKDDPKLVGFAGLTDASVSSENQGDIDRSNLTYAPDITYHLQQILDTSRENGVADSDIWLLTIHTQKVANASGSLYDNSYYQNLLYASYYNSLYGGGYGGYGYGYGSGYGYGGYSNYYNYLMLAQMMESSTQQTYSYTTELDKDRYYCGILNGPACERKPMFRVTFAIPQK